jgi:acetyl-CoA carboxylase carboxyltransferase component
VQPVASPLQGTVVSIDVADGDVVRAGQQLVVLESMKMEHVVAAEWSGTVTGVAVAVGQTVMPGEVLVSIEPGRVDGAVGATAVADVDLDHVRADLAEVVERHDVGLDHRRPEAVARRRASGQRTARENVADLLDDGSLVEYAPLVVAAQRRRRELQELIERTPADGLVGGVGTVAGHPVVAMSYDYTVLAGTQGLWNHRKKDRLFELAERQRLPVVIFTEGGGGRPGDTDGSGVAGLDCLAFNLFARLSGLVPLVGVNSGYCFAGNAALLGCCDVIIATENSNIGMGGPAMIEGGGLGTYEPTAIGPSDVQTADGVIDVLVPDEAAAVAVAQQYLSYFRGRIDEWSCADQRTLRHLIPENRVRAYDVRTVIDALCDTGSVLELRRGFGPGMITALARVEGRPLGLVANNPSHLGGAIDTPGADKAARFLQLCDAFDLPVLFLCDTPGFMVGPESETTGAVRHMARMFVTGANLTVPFATIILRKGYGLGAQAMAGGSFKAPLFCIAWPTGEFGGMNLEGAVRLGQRRELDAIADPEARERVYEQMVERMYQWGKAVNTAAHFEIDDVIDPADSRRWIASMLDAAPEAATRTVKKRPNVDTW